MSRARSTEVAAKHQLEELSVATNNRRQASPLHDILYVGPVIDSSMYRENLMVRKSNTQRFAAIALLGAVVVTFFAPVEAPAQSATKLQPPGLCTKERHRQLQDIVDVAKSFVAKCSSPPDTIEIMTRKADRFRDAAIARDNINLECFNRTDDGHNRQLQSMEEGLAFCKDRIQAKRKHQDRCPGK